MTTRECSKCKTKRPDKDFNWLNKAKNQKQYFCKLCMKAIRKDSYSKHKEKQIERVEKRNKRIREENRLKIIKYLNEHPCVDCGEDDLVVLQFDHVRDKKINSIAVMLQRAYSWEAIETEIGKCEIRCANCHIRKTTLEQNWKSRLL